MINHGSLFSGIGGFDLAAEWTGWNNVFHCEWNPFGQKVLKHYWPKAISYGDITKTDFTIHRGYINVLTGGFPCQPYSLAGKRLGKEDDRHLWPEMLRAIREIAPDYVVGENVYGLVNWNGGLVFNEVQSDLEAEGYEVQPVLLPACSVNAPHRRDRIWFVARHASVKRLEGGDWFSESRVFTPGREGFVAYPDNDRHKAGRKPKIKKNGIQSEVEQAMDAWMLNRTSVSSVTSDTGLFRQEERQEQAMGLNKLCTKRVALNSIRPTSSGYDTRKSEGVRMGVDWDELAKARREQGADIVKSSTGNDANTNYTGLQRSEIGGGIGGERKVKDQFPPRFLRSQWQEFPTQSPVRSGDDGVPTKLDGVTVSQHRKQSLMAYGNAIVPQVAFEIFKVIDYLCRTEPTA